MFIAIDGNSLLNRAFYGVKPLTNSKGFPTNAIYGFYRVLNKILNEFKPTHIMVAFDLKFPTFRHQRFENYKSNRKKMPEELFLQLIEIKQLLKLLGICYCEKKGFEADDLLGTISKICYKNKMNCVIASGDRDVLQLVNDYVQVRLSLKKHDELFDKNKILKTFGIHPLQLIEVKALMGDSSDNIPGVKGIGEKTALKLIENYGNVENIFENLNNLQTTTRIKNLLTQPSAKEICFLSKELATICLDVNLSTDLNFYLKKEINLSDLKCFLEKFELKNILKSLNNDENEFIEKIQKTKKKLPEIPKNKLTKICVVTEPEFNLVKQKIKIEKYLNFLFYEECLFIFIKTEIFKFKINPLNAFKNLIINSKKPKRTSNLKQVYKTSLVNGLNLTNVTLSCDLAFYLINSIEQNYNILNLIKLKFNSENVLTYFLNLCNELEDEIKNKNLNFLLNEIELPLSYVLAKMEIYGFKIDVKKLVDFGLNLTNKIKIIQNEIWADCGQKFNINSTKELNFILFDYLKLPKTKKNKIGYATDVESLQKLIKHNKIIEKILNYRTLFKLNSTYVEGLKKQIDANGRIHSHFKNTRTGRVSSAEPNIQNIPIKTELGSEIRNFFIANKNNVLIDGDYSQIELRILASLANDEKLINAFNSGLDVHSLTASKLFNIPIFNVSDELRRRAKTVNYSIIYGIGSFSLANSLKIGVNDAKNYIDNFFENFVDVKNYFENVIENAKLCGQVKTMFGRIRKIPELSSKSKKIIALGERIAKNTPIQGSCADLIKLAMIKINERFLKENIDANLILQVHDEILIETNKNNANLVAQILKTEMENVNLNLKVPLVVNVGIGTNWLKAKN